MEFSTILFTPAAILDLLANIEELKDLSIGVSNTLDGNVQIEIGDSTYIIQEPEDKENNIKVDEDVVEQVDNINEEAYQDIADQYDNVEQSEIIETGFFKTLGKVLMVGGLIKLLK